jgi:spore coat protein H
MVTRVVLVFGLLLPATLLSAGAAGFASPAVWPVRIEISPENTAKLRAQPGEYVAANIQILDESALPARVKLKGHGSFQSLDEKPSLTISFDGLRDAKAAQGVRKIHLNNSVEDPSFLKEQIGSEIFERAGIPTPRVGHARVTLNGRKLGLYVLKEGYAEDFLRRNFAQTEGALYEPEAGQDIDGKMQREIGNSEEQSELKGLGAAANEPDPTRRWDRLESVLDIDRFLTFMAVEIMICHWDGYCLSRNNFRVYNEGRGRRILFLPGGMDQIFSKPDLTWKPKMAGLVARSIMETPQGRERYESKFRNLFDSVFDPTKLTNHVAELVSELRPFLELQELKTTQVEARNLSEKIERRASSLRTQMSDQGPVFPHFINGRAELSGWKPFDEPAGGQMVEEPGALRIIAGPKTSSSWRTTVRLRPGRYAFSGEVQTADVLPLPFGSRNGATLRLIGAIAQSDTLMASKESRVLNCRFHVDTEAEVVLACELRASGGGAAFKKPLVLEVQQ